MVLLVLFLGVFVVLWVLYVVVLVVTSCPRLSKFALVRFVITVVFQSCASCSMLSRVQ